MGLFNPLGYVVAPAGDFLIPLACLIVFQQLGSPFKAIWGEGSFLAYQFMWLTSNFLAIKLFVFTERQWVDLKFLGAQC